MDEVLPACPRAGPDEQPDTSEPCDQVKVTVDEGADEGTKVDVDVPPEVSDSGLAKGDQLALLRTPGQDGEPAVLAYSRSSGRPRSGSWRGCSWWWSLPWPGAAA